MTRASEQRRCALDRAANRDAARANAGANQSAAHAISDAKNDARHERPQARTDAYRVLAQEKGKHAPTAAQPIANSRFHAAKQAFTEVDSYPHRSAARARPALHNGRALGSADKRDPSRTYAPTQAAGSAFAGRAVTPRAQRAVVPLFATQAAEPTPATRRRGRPRAVALRAESAPHHVRFLNLGKERRTLL